MTGAPEEVKKDLEKTSMMRRSSNTSCLLIEFSWQFRPHRGHMLRARAPDHTHVRNPHIFSDHIITCDRLVQNWHKMYRLFR